MFLATLTRTMEFAYSAVARSYRFGLLCLIPSALYIWAIGAPNTLYNRWLDLAVFFLIGCLAHHGFRAKRTLRRPLVKVFAGSGYVGSTNAVVLTFFIASAFVLTTYPFELPPYRFFWLQAGFAIGGSVIIWGLFLSIGFVDGVRSESYKRHGKKVDDETFKLSPEEEREIKAFVGAEATILGVCVAGACSFIIMLAYGMWFLLPVAVISITFGWLLYITLSMLNAGRKALLCPIIKKSIRLD